MLSRTISRSVGKSLTTCLFILLVTGCSSSGNSPLRYYLIEPVETRAVPDSDLAIEIVDLDIPEYLERVQIATRRSNNQLRFSDNHQWGENLRKNLTRTLARNLSRQLGTPDVGTPSQRSASRPDYRVQLFIQQFEQTADGRVVLSARWQLSHIDHPGDVTSHLTELESHQPSSDYPAIVDAMSRLFGQLAGQVSGAINVLQAGK